MSNTTQPAGMSQLQRLKALQEESKAKAQTSNMTAFSDLVGSTSVLLHVSIFQKSKMIMGKRSKMIKVVTYVAKLQTDSRMFLVSSAHLK